MKTQMRAEIKTIHVPDVETCSLSDFRPKEYDNFSLYIQLLVGPVGMDGEESFGFTVLTPSALAEKLGGSNKPITGRHMVFVSRFDAEALENWIVFNVQRCVGDTWDEVAEKLSRIGLWEFED